MDNSILAILCCPVSKTPLKHLNREQLTTVNQLIQKKEVEYVQGELVVELLDSALITEDEKVIYPIRDGIPILLADQGIGTTQLVGQRGFAM